MGMRPILRIKSISQQIIEKSSSKHSDLDASNLFAGYLVRTENENNVPRQYVDYQRVTYLDAITQNGSIDKITIYSLRPPELVFIKCLSWYFTLFERTSYLSTFQTDPMSQLEQLEKVIQPEYEKCEWVYLTQ